MRERILSIFPKPLLGSQFNASNNQYILPVKKISSASISMKYPCFRLGANQWGVRDYLMIHAPHFLLFYFVFLFPTTFFFFHKDQKVFPFPPDIRF